MLAAMTGTIHHARALTDGASAAQALPSTASAFQASSFGGEAGIVGVHSVRCEVGALQLQLPRSGPNGQPPEVHIQVTTVNLAAVHANHRHGK